MNLRNAIELLLLAALWGASFLFMRIGAPEFGPIPLIGMRIAIAAVFLLAMLAVRGQLAMLATHPRRAELVMLGVLNSALPFTLFAWAALGITAGLNSILNATAPMWTALIAFVWLRERLTAGRLAGLALGLAGVAVLVSGRGGADGTGVSLAAIGAGLLASLCYGIGVIYTRQRLSRESPWIVAAATQCAAALLIPLFGCLWGAALLGETITPGMLAGGAIVLLGTAFATGLLATSRGGAQTA